MKIDIGFGISIDIIESESSRIHNLISDKKDIRNLGVRLL
jgi:hypothetical protein